MRKFVARKLRLCMVPKCTTFVTGFPVVCAWHFNQLPESLKSQIISLETDRQAGLTQDENASLLTSRIVAYLANSESNELPSPHPYL